MSAFSLHSQPGQHNSFRSDTLNVMKFSLRRLFRCTNYWSEPLINRLLHLVTVMTFSGTLQWAFNYKVNILLTGNNLVHLLEITGKGRNSLQRSYKLRQEKVVTLFENWRKLTELRYVRVLKFNISLQARLKEINAATEKIWLLYNSC